MKISAEDYPSFKAFFAWMLEQLIPPLQQKGPIIFLDELERRAPARARIGLAMAIRDFIDGFDILPLDEVARIDAELSADGIVTLSEVRARLRSQTGRILKRGIRDETDYYALRNVVETLPEAEQAAGWELLATYEAKAAAQ